MMHKYLGWKLYPVRWSKQNTGIIWLTWQSEIASVLGLKDWKLYLVHWHKQTQASYGYQRLQQYLGWKRYPVRWTQTKHTYRHHMVDMAVQECNGARVENYNQYARHKQNTGIAWLSEIAPVLRVESYNQYTRHKQNTHKHRMSVWDCTGAWVENYNHCARQTECTSITWLLEIIIWQIHQSTCLKIYLWYIDIDVII